MKTLIEGSCGAQPDGFARGSHRTIKSILVLLLLLMPISGAYPLDLAEIALSSRIGEPLHARIPLRAFQPTDPETLQVKPAEAIHFSRAGLDRSPVLDLLEFKILRNPDGSAHIQITTDGAVNEPFLNLILEVSWSRGRILREYTLLLDPPVYADTGSKGAATIEQPVVTGDATPTRAKATGSSPEKRSPTRAVTATEGNPDGAGAFPQKTPSEYGPVTTRDTLWSIATRFRPDPSVSVEQMMLALQHHNPRAFSENNINSLQAGAILRIPDPETITTLSRTRALREVEQQHTAWEDLRQKLAKNPVAAPTGSPAPDVGSKTDPPDPKQSGRVEILSAGTAEEGVARTGEAIPGKEDLAELRAEISLVKEEMGAKSRENRELKIRLAEAENLIREFGHLIEIQSDEINALKAKLARTRSLASGPSTESPDAGPGLEEAPSIEAATPITARTTPKEGARIPDEGPGTRAPEPEQSVVASPSVREVPELVMEEQPASEPEVSPAQPDGVESPGLGGEPERKSATAPIESESAVGIPLPPTEQVMDYIRDNLIIIAAVLGGILLVIFVVMASWLRDRSMEKASTEGGAVAGRLAISQAPEDDTAVEPQADRPPEPQPDAGDDPRETGATDGETPPTREEASVQPEAIGKTEVEESRTPEGGKKADKPLTGESTPPPPVPDDSPNILDDQVTLDMGFGDDGDDVSTVEPDGAKKVPGKKDIAQKALSGEDIADLDMGTTDLNAISNIAPANVAPKKAAPEQPDDMTPPTPEWALNFAGPDLQEISPAETDDTKTITGENMDFNFGFDLDMDASPGTGSRIGGDDNIPLFDFPPVDASSGIDEMQTKLDLAQAYIDMGDTEGARVILEKVLADGEENHKTLAKELLEKFG
uniref:FimV N-terminal domain-containing protein n=1 Tax=Candidatus Kentrum eta TaxID=2126337 RepID=A0A450VBE1_9GAMM|nr:MAG: FimV N-terminal domain-containing protein [Candidatus Kentron sp. H]VFJ95730.1 MAG: FimV N-terminal domain-containing protein [Candidatus Kentron sp. H]VFK02094.1 MAG: FimV N-terminal domain-containing protein [Candidatus Kentron sp. H]